MAEATYRYADGHVATIAYTSVVQMRADAARKQSSPLSEIVGVSFEDTHECEFCGEACRRLTDVGYALLCDDCCDTAEPAPYWREDFHADG
jgi:hypothetical protein